MAPEPTVVGVDGTRGGWIAVAVDGRGVREVQRHARFVDVLAAWPAAVVVAVDVPIGLLERGERDADGAAKRFLGRGAASVFPTAPRPVYAARDYAEANALARRLTGKGLSKQSWLLGDKVREVDAVSDDTRLHEVHPEVAFRLLAGAALGSKKTWGGLMARRARLAAAGLVLPDALGAADVAAPDDVVDAAVCAWSARRIARGAHLDLPASTTQRDARTGRVPRIRG